MTVVRLVYFVDTDDDAAPVEGSAYATGGWGTGEKIPFWQVAPLPVVVIATCDKEADPERPRESMKGYPSDRLRHF